MPNGKLRSFRAQKGVSLKKFAEHFAVHKTTVLRWEEHVPAERVVPISEFTGIPRHELRPDLYPEMEHNNS